MRDNNKGTLYAGYTESKIDEGLRNLYKPCISPTNTCKPPLYLRSKGFSQGGEG